MTADDACRSGCGAWKLRDFTPLRHYPRVPNCTKQPWSVCHRRIRARQLGGCLASYLWTACDTGFVAVRTSPVCATFWGQHGLDYQHHLGQIRRESQGYGCTCTGGLGLLLGCCEDGGPCSSCPFSCSTRSVPKTAETGGSLDPKLYA